MARDIEEFLRRAAERRQQQKQEATPSNPNPIQDKQPRHQFSQAPAPAEEPIVQDVEIVETRKVAKKKRVERESVSEHVQKYLDTSDIKQKTQSLGSQVARTGQDFEKTVKQHLSQDICTVDNDRESLTTQTKSGTNLQAMRLREMLSRPETIAQAILIAEILKPPSFEFSEDE